MELQRSETRSTKKPIFIEDSIPTAPTIDDFYIDPGIDDPIEENITGSQPAFYDPLGVNNFIASAPIEEHIDNTISRPIIAKTENHNPYSDVQGDISKLSLQSLNQQELESSDLTWNKSDELKEIQYPSTSIIPFTDSQLHALYHNAELEKNLEFVDHWLETQKDIEKFDLDELLVNIPTPNK